jgi:dihydroxy-acid dehydratase
MSFSLQSHNIIANSIGTTMGGQWYDGLIAISGCDKNMPGCLIAMVRLYRPSIMVYGGTIRAGCTDKFPRLDIVSAFQSYGESLYNRIIEEERQEIVRISCPGNANELLAEGCVAYLVFHTLQDQELVEACIRQIPWPRRLKR